MSLEFLLLDLDNTLYPKSVGLIEHIDQRIDDYLMERLSLEKAAVNALRREYYLKYGTTLRGVKENHGIDPLEYFDHAYHVDLKQFLTPDPELKSILRRIPAYKAIFSNSPRGYVERVLDALGVRGEISRIFDLAFSDYRGKPDPSAYRMVLQELGAEGRACVMVEDCPVNLIPAKELGMTTVLIGDPAETKSGFIDYRIESIYKLPELWNNPV